MTPEQQKAIALANARARAAQAQQPSQQGQDMGVVSDQLSGMLPDTPVMSNTMRQLENSPWWAKALAGVDDGVSLLANGATMGQMPNVAAGVRSTVLGTDFDKEKQAAIDNVNRAKERAGLTGSLLEGGGMAATGIGAMSRGITAAAIPKVGPLLGGVIDNSIMGGVYNQGQGEDVLTGMGLGALGGVAGNVLGGVGNRVAKYFRGPNPSLPTYEQIAKKGADKYAASKAENVVYSNDAVKRLSDQLRGKFADRAADPLTEPGAFVALQSLAKKTDGGLPFTAETLQSQRQIANRKFIPGNLENNALLNEIKGGIDDFRMNPQQGDVLSGDAVKAAQLSKEADKLWSQKKKIDTVREAMRLAENRAARSGTGGNLENTAKQELSKILNDPRKSRGFTPDEKSAIENAVFNQKGRDALRFVSRLNPLKHTVSGVGGAAALGSLGGPLAALLSAGAGMAGHAAATGIQRSKVKALEELIRAGGSSANLAKVKEGDKMLSGQSKALLGLLLSSGGLSAQ